MQQLSNEETIRELARTMRFSEIFFDAFPVTRNRAAQWHFIAILLRLEANAEIGVRELRNDKECRNLIDSLKYQTRDHALKVLVDDCRDKDGGFIDHPEDRTKDRKYRLNHRFKAAATRYVQAFDAKLGFPDAQLDQLPPISAMKFIFGTLKDEYYPKWLELVSRLGKLWRPNESDQAAEFRDELRSKAPYWTILVTTWRHALGDRTISTDESGMWRATFDSMRGADPGEVKACIAYLSKKDGPQTLLRSRQNGVDVFAINPDYNDAFEWYAAEICELNNSLSEKLLSLPSSYS